MICENLVTSENSLVVLHDSMKLISETLNLMICLSSDHKRFSRNDNAKLTPCDTPHFDPPRVFISSRYHLLLSIIGAFLRAYKGLSPTLRYYVHVARDSALLHHHRSWWSWRCVEIVISQEMTPFSFADSAALIAVALVHLLPWPEEPSSPQYLMIRPNSEPLAAYSTCCLALSFGMIKIFFQTLEDLIALSMKKILLVPSDCRSLFWASIATLASNHSTPLRLHSLPGSRT